MNLLAKTLILAVCLISISSSWSLQTPTLRELVQSDQNTQQKNELEGQFSVLINKLKQFEPLTPVRVEEEQKVNRTRTKRQLAFGGGLGLGFGAYDYNDYYGDYASDYAYDYYDWICSDTSCQLCDILTSECCDPELDVNCFLPDSCLNNPCLSGGTCITSRTLDNRPDFVCVCLPGLTGKYCQLTNDYFVGAEIALAPVAPIVPVAAPVVDPMPAQPTYQPPAYQQQAPPAPAYQQPQQQAPMYQQQAPAYQQQAPMYQQPMQAPAYQQPQQAPMYQQPQQQAPMYQQPQQAPAYQQPQPTYEAPTYQPPAPQYQAPQQAPQYQAPQQAPMYQQAAAQQYAAPQQSQYGQQQPDGSLRSLSAAGIKRKKCGEGQIYSAESNACVDFSLKKKK